MLIMLLIACQSTQAEEPTSILEVDRAHLDDADAPSPEDIIDADTVVIEPTGEGDAVFDVVPEPVEAEGIYIDASALPMCQPMPGGGPSFMEKWGAEIWLAIFTGFALWQRRKDITAIVDDGINVLKEKGQHPAQLDKDQAREALKELADELLRISRDATTDRDRFLALYESALKEIDTIKAGQTTDLSGAKTISEAREVTRNAGAARLFR